MRGQMVLPTENMPAPSALVAESSCVQSPRSTGLSTLHVRDCTPFCIRSRRKYFKLATFKVGHGGSHSGVDGGGTWTVSLGICGNGGGDACA